MPDEKWTPENYKDPKKAFNDAALEGRPYGRVSTEALERWRDQLEDGRATPALVQELKPPGMSASRDGQELREQAIRDIDAELSYREMMEKSMERSEGRSEDDGIGR